MATKTNTILKKIACNLHALLNFGSTNGLHSVSAGAYLAIRMIESRQSVAKKSGSILLPLRAREQTQRSVD